MGIIIIIKLHLEISGMERIFSQFSFASDTTQDESSEKHDSYKNHLGSFNQFYAWELKNR
jgi:hypothetical protein